MKRVAVSLVVASTLFLNNLSAGDKFRETNRDEVNINFKDLKIVDFIKMVAKITGKNILISQNVTGTVDYISVKPIKKSHVYNLLVDILASKGYTLRDTGSGFLKVIKSSDASKSAPPLYGTSDIGEVQTEIIPIENLNVRTILRQVNFLLSRYGKISLSNENNAIVVTDYPQNIKTIKRVIDRLDQDRGSVVRFITLRNAEAKSVYPKARQMVNALFNSKIATQKITIFADDASNSIVMIGDGENIAQVAPFIRKMDRADETVEKKMEIIYVKNADATEIVKTLEKLLSDKSFGKREEPRESKTITTHIPRKSKNGKPLPPIVKTETVKPSIIGGDDKPTVTVDSELNAIIVYATERELKEIREVISSLDTERKQVYVVAKIIEISQKRAKALGAKYDILGGIAGGNGIYGIGTNLLGSKGSFAPITTIQRFTDFNLPKLDKVFAIGVALDLLSSKGVTKILSEPSILCINNKESSIYVGQTESILTQSTTASTTTALPIQNYKREDIGLTLKVKPRISADNKVSLEVSVKSEDIESQQQNSLQPTTTKREVKTSSIVMNGETVIIGGLTRDKIDKGESRVPFLGDIPILGIPFRHKNDEGDTRSLVIMLTPYIINRSEELSQLRDALGRLSFLEKDTAKEIERKLDSGELESISSDSYETQELESYEEGYKKEIIIDEYGRTYAVYYDKSGKEVRREEVDYREGE
jgi:general secretion pathway protein D